MNGFVTGLFTGLLSVGVIATSPRPDVHPDSSPEEAPQEEKLEQVFHVNVFLRDAMEQRDNVTSREVQLVRDCLSPVLSRISEPAECARAVRSVLESSFGSRVEIEELDPVYKAVWDAEAEPPVFQVICCDSLAISVDIDGTIVSVPVEVGTFLD